MELEQKCNCAMCDGGIAFDPAEFVFSYQTGQKAYGQAVQCPHCGHETRVYRIVPETKKSPLPPQLPAKISKTGSNHSWTDRLTSAAFLLCVVAVFSSFLVIWHKRQTIVTGRIFIVTQEGMDIGMGDEKVALLDAADIHHYYDSMGEDWKSNLLVSQSAIYTDEAAYQQLERSNLNALIASRNVWKNYRASAVIASDQYETASEEIRKINQVISDIYGQKRLSRMKVKLDEDVQQQLSLLARMACPSVEDVCPKIDVALTDSHGDFRFVVGGDHPDMFLLAEADRKTPGEGESRHWLVPVHLKGKRAAHYVLSNDNSDEYTDYGLFSDANIKNWITAHLTNSQLVSDVQSNVDPQETADEMGN